MGICCSDTYFVVLLYFECCCLVLIVVLIWLVLCFRVAWFDAVLCSCVDWLRVGCVGGRIGFVVASIFLVSVSFL